jgi:hypothetical protein
MSKDGKTIIDVKIFNDWLVYCTEERSDNAVILDIKAFFDKPEMDTPPVVYSFSGNNAAYGLDIIDGDDGPLLFFGDWEGNVRIIDVLKQEEISAIHIFDSGEPRVFWIGAINTKDFYASNHEGLFSSVIDGNVTNFTEKDGNISSGGILIRENQAIYVYSKKKEE